MNNNPIIPALTISLSRLAISIALVTATANAYAWESDPHVFSINDVQGGFDGSTFGVIGARQDTGILCGAPGSTISCPPTISPIVDKEGITLYPVDSEFGFFEVDFLGAKPKTRDGDYREGFVGNIPGGGIKVSNAVTDVYKVT